MRRDSRYHLMRCARCGLLALLSIGALASCGKGGGDRARRPDSAAGSSAGAGASSEAGGGKARRSLEARKGGAGPLQKHVTDQANFVLYLPRGWTSVEKTHGSCRTVTVTDDGGQYLVEMSCGPGREAADARAQAWLADRARGLPGLSLVNSMRSDDRSRVVFDGSYEDPARGPREFRCWVTSRDGTFLSSRIDAPRGRLEENRAKLLSILSNIRVTKGALDTAAPLEVPLVPHRLRDGSASFKVPADWNVADLGKAQFIASDPTERYSFMVAKAEMITPQLGVRPPGVVVLPFLSPHEALAALTTRLGIASNVRFQSVNRHPDLEQQIARGGGGASQIEDFLFTCDGKKGPTRGFSFGMCFYSRLGTNWSLIHFTVGAAAGEFDAYAPNFLNMLQSFQVNEAWMADYVRRGLENVRRLQQQTSRLVARNADEIHQLMQQAYDERQRSQDYIDYQRTNYIRGEQDWISSVEGGTIYHSDTWGLTNTTTGEFHEGQPFDYVHFQGENPKYRETMTPIDNRELYEKHVAGK